MPETDRTKSRLSVLSFDPAKRTYSEASPAAISDLLEAHHLLWVDIVAPCPDDVRMLQEEFGLHPLGLEEILTPHPRPRCLVFEGHYILVLYAARRRHDQELTLQEVVLFIGERFLITTHAGHLREIDECIRRWQAGNGPRNGGIEAPLYSLLDTLVDAYFPIVDDFAETVEAAENRIFAGQTAEHASELFALKKEMLVLRRAVAGQRDALNALLRQDIALIPEAALVYFQSVYDHMVRLVESIDTYRDLVSSAMDMHLSVLSNRMNQVMKTLTVLSTILMSAGLIAGIYGMNFENMPELHTRYGYYGALAAMALVAAALAALFRWLKWF